MAVTTVDDLNGLFNTIYERALFVARENNLMAALVNNTSATGWMDRKVPIRPLVVAESVGETEEYNNPQDMGKSLKATITPGEIMAQGVITDRARETDPDDAMGDAAMSLGMAIATKIDVDLVGTFGSATTDKGDGAGNPATLSKVAAGIAVLTNNHARQYGKPSIVLHPYHWHDIWVELGQPSTNNVGEARNQALADYFVSNMLAADWYTSANIAVDASDDAVSGMFVKDAIMLDTRRAPVMEPERSARGRRWELNFNAGYGYGIVRQEFIIGFTADASEPA